MSYSKEKEAVKMANSRIYIRNKKTHEILYLGKSYGSGYKFVDYSGNWVARYNTLLNHAAVLSGLNGYSDDGAALREVFELVCEDELKEEDVNIL